MGRGEGGGWGWGGEDEVHVCDVKRKERAVKGRVKQANHKSNKQKKTEKKKRGEDLTSGFGDFAEKERGREPTPGGGTFACRL